MIKNPYSGKFIAIEGLDGSGLTTQAKLLKEFLEKKGIEVILTKEPTKISSVSGEIQKILSHKKTIDPFNFQKLFAQDRKEHLEKIIIPALKKGKWVISDRYAFSSFAFGAETKKDIEKIIQLNENFLMPDLVILLKVNPEICIKRIQGRGGEVKLFEKKEKLEKVWKNYCELTKIFTNIQIVNGEGSIQKVQRTIQNIIAKKLLWNISQKSA
jgi:dTMP kinase